MLNNLATSGRKNPNLYANVFSEAEVATSSSANSVEGDLPRPPSDEDVIRAAAEAVARDNGTLLPDLNSRSRLS